MIEENAVMETNKTTALVTLNPEQYVTETFAGYEQRFTDALVITKDVEYNVQTKDGLAVAKNLRKLFKDIRIDAEKMRVERKDPIIKIGKLIDSTYKALEEKIAVHEALHDKVIKAEEERIEAEKAEKLRLEELRKSEINNAILKITEAVVIAVGMKSSQIVELLEQIRSTEINNETFGDRDVEAENAKFKAIDALTSLLGAKKAQEQQALAEAERVANESAQLAEKARVDAIKLKITLMENSIAQASLLDTAGEVVAIIKKVEAINIDDSYLEFKAQAEASKANVLKALSRTLNMVKLEEAQAMEQRAKELAKKALQQTDTVPAIMTISEPVEFAVNSAGYVSISSLSSNLVEPFNESDFKQVFSTNAVATKAQVEMVTPPTAEQLAYAVSVSYSVDKSVAYGWLVNAFSYAKEPEIAFG